MSTNICQNCIHYRQHYLRDTSNRYRPLNCGHCTYPRLKNRKPMTAACPFFEVRLPESPCADELTKDQVYHWLLTHLSDS